MGIAGLDALERSHYEIAAVFTHEDDQGENCWFGSVKNWALSRGIPCTTTEEINTQVWRDTIASWQPEMIFSFYYRKMIRPEILDIPKIGSFNLHGSLLPAYRGRCPVNWVLVNGEERTGVTLHYMVEKPDAGDIVAQKIVAIDIEDTAKTLYGKLCAAAGQLLDEVLPGMKEGRIPRMPQDLSRGSYFGGRKPEDGRIDWKKPAFEIYNLIRSVTDPYPGAFAFTGNGEKIIIWHGKPVILSNPEEAGNVSVHDQDVLVKTGYHAIKLLDIEIAGKRMTDAEVCQYFKTGKVRKLT